MRLIAGALSNQGRLAAFVSLCDSRADAASFAWADRRGVRFFGCDGSKWRFAARLGLESSPRHYVLFGHIAQAPIGLLLKAAGRIRKYGAIIHGVEGWQKLPMLQLYALRHASVIICTTPYSAEQLVRFNSSVRRQALAILPLALEADRFDGVVEIKPSMDGPLRALSVGRMIASEPGKGIDHTIAALAMMRNSANAIEYTVIGCGDDVRRLRALAEKHGVAVVFRGSVSDSELRTAYREADVFVLPSKQEGFGLAYLEAMNFLLPVIACPEGGVPYVVRDGHNGLLVRYGCSQEIAAALCKLMEPDYRRRLGKQARKDVLDRFTPARFERDLDNIMEKHC